MAQVQAFISDLGDLRIKLLERHCIEVVLVHPCVRMPKDLILYCRVYTAGSHRDLKRVPERIERGLWSALRACWYEVFIEAPKPASSRIELPVIA